MVKLVEVVLLWKTGSLGVETLEKRENIPASL